MVVIDKVTNKEVAKINLLESLIMCIPLNWIIPMLVIFPFRIDHALQAFKPRALQNLSHLSPIDLNELLMQFYHCWFGIGAAILPSFV